MKKIIHIGGGGGIDFVIKELVVGLENFDSKAIFFGWVDKKNNYSLQDIYYRKIKWVGKFNALGYLKGTYELTKLLRKESPDVVVLHGFISSVFGSIAATASKTSLIISIDHGPQLNFLQFKKILFRLINKFIDGFICVSKSSKDWFLQNFYFISPDKVTVIENCVDLEKFFMIRGRNFKSTPYIITMVSRIDLPSKDPHTLVKAIKLLQQKNYPVFLRFVGDGNAKKEIEDLSCLLGLESKVEITGFTYRVSDFLKDTDIFVLSTMGEGMPISILEAMAVGLPIIASRVIGVTDVIKHENTGLLVEPRNPKLLAENIERLINNPEYGINLGFRARKTAEQRFSRKTFIKRYNLFFNNFFGKKKIKTGFNLW